MIADYNHQAARSFAAALREGDREAAFKCGHAVTTDPNAVNYGIPLDREYNDTELADLIEGHLNGIDRGLWNMTSQVHLPVVISAICYWVTEEEHKDENGEISSKSLAERKEQDVPGS